MFGFLKGLGVTLRELPKHKVTLQYPDVRPEWPERFRGVHRLLVDECIVCNQCARICPTDCISLSGTRGEDKKIRLDTFDINFDTCILCDLCTEVCPTEAILMSDTFEMAQYSRDNLYLDMHWLHDNELRYERNHPERFQKDAEGNEATETAGEPQ